MGFEFAATYKLKSKVTARMPCFGAPDMIFTLPKGTLLECVSPGDSKQGYSVFVWSGASKLDSLKIYKRNYDRLQRLMPQDNDKVAPVLKPKKSAVFVAVQDFQWGRAGDILHVARGGEFPLYSIESREGGLLYERVTLSVDDQACLRRILGFEIRPVDRDEDRTNAYSDYLEGLDSVTPLVELV